MPTLAFDLVGAGVDVAYAGAPSMYGGFDPLTKGIFRLIGSYIDVEYATTDCTANDFGNNQQAACLGRLVYTDGSCVTEYVIDRGVVTSVGGGKIRLRATLTKVPG